MRAQLNRFTPQPLVAITISSLALIIVIVLGLEGHYSFTGGDALVGCLAAFLGAAVVVAGMHPIHIRRNIKAFLTTVPLYVAALLLPPAITTLMAGISTLALQLLTRAQHGNTPSDVATATGRWVIIGFVSAWAAQQLAGAPLPLTLLSVVVVMLVCDIVTGAIEIAPMSGESPWRSMGLYARESILPESAQYLLGILATLAAMQELWSLALWVLPLCFVYQSFKQAKEMHDGTGKLLESMADAVDLRDPYTGGHSRRVTELTMRILNEMAVTGPEVELIRSAARVHDIGKIGIPDQILNKPGRLTEEEKQIMDSHPERGASLLARYKDFARGMDIVRHHHERWDGAGYPDGLKGLDIPFGARVIAVADSFDAMTSDRPYRAGMPIHQAVRILREGRGTQWEPAIVEAFLRCIGDEQLDATSVVVAAESPAPAIG